MNDRLKRRINPDSRAMYTVVILAIVVFALFCVAFRLIGPSVAKLFADQSQATSVVQNEPSASVAPVDPAYQVDSLLARQLLASSYNSPRVDMPLAVALESVRPLDAGTLAGSGNIGNYHCDLPKGGHLLEVTPDHHGRILVVYSTSTLPVMRGAGDCSGGEVLLLSTGELAIATGK